MNRVVISTVGTSLLTNQINRNVEDEKTWYDKLRNTAQLSQADTPDEVLEIIEILSHRAMHKLSESSISKIRLASAELNGIYGLYKDNVELGKIDIHWLIATDTAQGITTANIVENFLKQQGIVNANVYKPKGLSTATTQTFAEGIDDLRDWLKREIEPLKSSYKIYFNLVGGFKSLQGYLNTIGMFYADEIIYIFEGKESNLITIPRLPIKIDTESLEAYKVQLALMDAGLGLSQDQVDKIPEALISDFDGKKILSTWGKLIWDESKAQLLSQALLQLPRINYADTFRADYNKIRDVGEKYALQQDITKVSAKLIESNGDTSLLLTPFKYTRYQNSDQIDHFRISRSMRVSCKAESGNLTLRYYGTHDHVERSERLR